jgi:ankyrin repeat protein
MRELYAAVRANDAAQVSALIAADPSLAIFAAAMQGDSAQVEKLLSANRSLVAAVSSDGWTPLHLAAHFGHTGAVRMLINKGADVAARSRNAMANTALHAATAGRSVEVMKVLLECGAGPNARQSGGFTPLHAAAQTGETALAETLLDGGADVNVRADNRQTPLDFALLQGRQAMVEFLESRGATL